MSHAPSTRLGGFLLLVRRGLARHRVSTVVTVLSVALGTGLVLSVFSVERQAYAAFTGGELGFDAVLGGRGSKLQLVLNSVFHLETAPGKIPWSLYQAVKSDPRVALALPYAVGDNYRGWRIVGTTDEIFTDFEYQRGRRFEFAGPGRPFDVACREAVIGSVVAQKTGLTLGSRFSPYHGVAFDESNRHVEEYVVVGVLKPTSTPSDRVVWIPIEGVFRMGGHELSGTGQRFEPKAGEAIPDEHKEVSAVMLRFRTPHAGLQLSQKINDQGQAATLAWPLGTVMAELFDKLGWMVRILGFVAWMVLVVAAGSILASLHATLNARRREFAVLRALGARPSTLFLVIVTQALVVALLGTLLGFLVHVGMASVASEFLRVRTGVVLSPFAFDSVHVWVPCGMMLLGLAAGAVPAFGAYRTDVETHLSQS